MVEVDFKFIFRIYFMLQQQQRCSVQIGYVCPFLQYTHNL